MISPPEFIFSFELSRLYFLSFSTWIHIIGLGFDIPNLSWFLHLHINKISFSTMESRGRHFCCVIQVFCLMRLKLIMEDCFFLIWPLNLAVISNLPRRRSRYPAHRNWIYMHVYAYQKALPSFNQCSLLSDDAMIYNSSATANSILLSYEVSSRSMKAQL